MNNIFNLVLGINGGLKTSNRLRDNRPVRAYHLTGRFGRSTESHFNDSPVTARATYDHIGNDKINGLVSSMQASHQKKMYEMCGVDLQSQAAYDLAVQGPIRPMVTNIPLIYGIRCIEFKRPYFTIGELFKKLVNFLRLKIICLHLLFHTSKIDQYHNTFKIQINFRNSRCQRD